MWFWFISGVMWVSGGLALLGGGYALISATQAGMHQQFGQGAGFKMAYGNNFDALASDTAWNTKQKYADGMGTAISAEKNLGTPEQMQKYVSAVAENAGNKISSTIGTAEGAIEGKELAKKAHIEALKKQGMSEEEAKAIANKTDYVAETARREGRERLEGFALMASGQMDSALGGAKSNITPKSLDEMKNLANMTADAKTEKFAKTQEYQAGLQDYKQAHKGEQVISNMGGREPMGRFKTNEELEQDYKKQLHNKFYNEEMANQQAFNEKLKANLSANLEAVQHFAGTRGFGDAVNAMAHQGAINMAKGHSEQSVSLNSAISSGYMQSDGNLTALGKQGLSHIESQKYSSMVNTASAMNNKEGFTRAMQQMGLNSTEINQINSLSGMDKANAFASKVATAQFSGTVRGRSFNVRMGADGGEMNGTFDSSINVRGGYNVDMGSALGASGWAMGGVSGMRAMGIAKTAYDGAMGVVDVATNFIPGGKAFKNISGLTNFASRGKWGTSPVGKAGKKGDGAKGVGDLEGAKAN